MNCPTCRWSNPVLSDIEEEGPLLNCQRYPPQLFAFEDQVTQAWPKMEDGDWCGEYSEQVE